jgi:hypothetical protein
MTEMSKEEKTEALQDVFYGQIVFIWARWIVIFSTLFLVLRNAQNVADIQIPMIPIGLLIVANFYLHGRFVMRQPANPILLTIATTIDFIFITLVIVLGAGGGTGIDNPFFVLYFPVMLAYSLVFPRRRTLVMAFLLIVVYFLICLLLPPRISIADGDEKVLAVRIVMLLVTALLGTMYWRIQRMRRRGKDT